jgi:cysteine synthase A
MQVVGKCGMNSAQNVIAAIGHTPLMCIGSLAGDDHAKIWVKWEGANPTGSMKDRMALSMI